MHLLFFRRWWNSRGINTFCNVLSIPGKLLFHYVSRVDRSFWCSTNFPRKKCAWVWKIHHFLHILKKMRKKLQYGGCFHHGEFKRVENKRNRQGFACWQEFDSIPCIQKMNKQLGVIYTQNSVNRQRKSQLIIILL